MGDLAALATQPGAVPDLARVPGVSSVAVDGRVVRCHVRGPVAPLLTVLAGANVTELLSREPSLEELFLAQYGDRADVQAGDQAQAADEADKTETADIGTQVARHDAG